MLEFSVGFKVGVLLPIHGSSNPHFSPPRTQSHKGNNFKVASRIACQCTKACSVTNDIFTISIKHLLLRELRALRGQGREKYALKVPDGFINQPVDDPAQCLIGLQPLCRRRMVGLQLPVCTAAALGDIHDALEFLAATQRFGIHTDALKNIR